MLNRRQFCLLTMGIGTAGLGMVGYAASRGQGPQTATETNGSSAHDLVLTSRKSKALGAEQGLTLVRSQPACEALFVFKDGRILATRGFPTNDA